MAGSVNKVILVGNLGKDPEGRFTPSGRAIAKFSIATTEPWMDQESGRQERTEWHNIVVWGKQAESCGQYLAKGRQVFIEGAIRSGSYDDKEVNKRYITEVIAQRVQFLGSGGGGSGRGTSAEGGGGGGAAAGGSFDEFGGGQIPEDDVPF